VIEDIFSNDFLRLTEDIHIKILLPDLMRSDISISIKAQTTFSWLLDARNVILTIKNFLISPNKMRRKYGNLEMMMSRMRLMKI
jgi:hypothetical protein